MNLVPGYHALDPLPLDWFKAAVALPSVYDDALSYMEILARVTAILNNVINQLNDTNNNTDALREAFDKLQTFVNDYFDNLDVNAEISDKVNAQFDHLSENGQLAQYVTNALAYYFNPVFVNSVSDMKHTDYAYALESDSKLYQWQNNEYKFNGYTFGGYVDSSSSMTNPAQMYALVESNRLWKWSGSVQAWTDTNITFGGVVPAISEMTDKNKIFVLKSNAHIYQWNADTQSYSDTGIIYGAGAQSFIERTPLTSQNDITQLTQSGWYTFSANSFPLNMPNITPSSGVAIVYNGENGKSILVMTAAGANYALINGAWIALSFGGSKQTSDANNVTPNTCVLVRPANCDNTPDTDDTYAWIVTLGPDTGQLLTSQLCLTPSYTYFRVRTPSGWHEWEKFVNYTDLQNFMDATTRIVDSYQTETTNRITSFEQRTNQAIDIQNGNLDSFIQIVGNALTTANAPIYTSDNKQIATNTENTIAYQYYTVKTAKNLTSDDVPLDSAFAGSVVDNLYSYVNSADSTLQNNINSLNDSVSYTSYVQQTQINALSNENIAQQTQINANTATINKMSPSFSTLSDSIVSNSYATITADNGNDIAYQYYTVKTAKNLTSDDVPLDSAFAGSALQDIYQNANALNLSANSQFSLLHSTVNQLSYAPAVVYSVNNIDLSPLLTSNGENIASSSSVDICATSSVRYTIHNRELLGLASSNRFLTLLTSNGQTLCGYSAYVYTPLPSFENAFVTIIGDSITAGEGVPKQYAWANLFCDLMPKFNSSGVNKGLSGTVISHWSNYSALSSNVLPPTNIVLCCLGTNDRNYASYDYAQSMWETGLITINEYCKSIHATLIVIPPIPTGPSKNNRNIDIATVTLLIQNVCRTLNIPFIDLYSAVVSFYFFKNGSSGSFRDDLHPDSSMHIAMFILTCALLHLPVTIPLPSIT